MGWGEMPKIIEVPEERLRAQVGEVAADLEALQFRLLGVHASLPSDQEPDLFSPFRAAIECVLADRLAPATEALRDLVADMEKETPRGDVH
jgi:hypothetical protein